MQTSTTNFPRIKLLIAIHLLVGIAPLAMFSLPETNWMFPAMWALSSLSIAQIMLLSFWVGMGRNRGVGRTIGAFGGTAYVSFWPMMAQFLAFPDNAYDSLFTKEFLVEFSSYGALVLLLSCAFLLIRRKGISLVHLSELNTQIEVTRLRYSTFHLLLLMSICSVVLSLTKIAQPSEQTSIGFGSWTHVAGLILMLVVFLMNNLCAAWATLSLNSPWSRIALVIGIAFLSGVSFAVAFGYHSFSWFMVISASLIPVLATTIVVASLLVVRSNDYRVVRNQMLRAAT
ncbi:hypothetical protein [Bythopirellula polymerisocia]|uniref:Uncharacterized protein n=1 Tax=Bythopirellula polymerisocia TaxID=2528003 RepID=A0A5C6CXJ5_9BACT|nr:hypothetical protein [Bythopirellula polymerisocia]TWU28191.1 hypothetical protein Pla144_14780 [Bythopirellula polymerisocia]